MSANFWNQILGPPTDPRDWPRNPQGQGFNGMSPDFPGVPRIGPDGNIRVINPFEQSAAMSGPPMDSITPQIQREDFPEGAEGDRQYAEAVEAFMRGDFPQGNPTGFDAQGNPVFDQNPYDFTPPGGQFPGSGRSVTEQAIWNFYNAGQNAGQHHGGLNVISRARVRPEEALLAMTSPGTSPGEPPGYFDAQGQPIVLDDATLREMLAGVGGPQSVENYLGLVGGGQDGSLGQFQGEPGAEGQDGGLGQFQGGRDRGIPPGPIQREETPPQFGEQNQGITGPLPPGAGGAGGMMSFDDIQPPEQSLAEGPPPEIEGGWQFSEVGPDVFLDVTDPRDGSTHRFTGDVVETVYQMMGYNSWEEMVMGEGYDNAVSALFGFITPLKPPGQTPQPPIQPAGQPPPAGQPSPDAAMVPSPSIHVGDPGTPMLPGGPGGPYLPPPQISTKPGGGPQ